jgi:hypothetical protein
LWVQDTCGYGDANTTGMRRPLFSLFALPLPYDNLTAFPTIGTNVEFHSGIMTSPGGKYQLCWCAAGFACSVSEQMRVDAGELTFIGPSPRTQRRTCISGQTCRVDGLLGQDLSSDDAFMVLDTCGLLRQTPLFTGLGILKFVDVSNVTHARGPGVATWGSEPQTAAGGRYKLCWCAGGFSCSTPAEFRSQIGTLVLRGPAPLQQQRTCISGQTCVIEGILGESLQSQDRIMTLDTCGIRNLVERFTNVGNFAQPLASGALYVGTNIPETSKGGLYRLCWCGLSQYPSGVVNATAPLGPNGTNAGVHHALWQTTSERILEACRSLVSELQTLNPGLASAVKHA